MSLPKIELLIWNRQAEIDKGHKYGPINAGCDYALYLMVGEVHVDVPFNTLAEFPGALKIAGERLSEYVK